jgi:hypothetical protein
VLVSKPRQWAFSPALVASDWDWFWDKVTIAVPLWTGAGIREFPIWGRRGWVDETAPDQEHKSVYLNSGLTWEAGRGGPGVRQNSDGETFRLGGNLVAFQRFEGRHVDFSTDTEISFFCLVDVVSYGAGNPGFWRTGGTNESNGTTFLIKSGANGLWARWNGTNGFRNTTDALPTGLNSFGCSMKSGDQRGYINGVKKETSAITGTPTGRGKEVFNIGGQGGDNGDEELCSDGVFHCFYLFDRFLKDSQHQALANDPFGPFRMADDVGAYPAVATGRIMSSLAGAGGLAGPGGIAGMGGGLAA